MDLFVMDDSTQRQPSRPGMGRLVAVGGIHVPGNEVTSLERKLDEICGDHGFPRGEEFKWSPSRKSWMRDSLQADDRAAFFRDCLDAAEEADVRAMVVIEDVQYRVADRSSSSHEEDVTKLCLERADNYLGEINSEAIVLSDRPSGGTRRDEDEFVLNCLETFRDGTRFVKFDRLGLLVTADSKHARLLQLADLVTSCTLSFVSGQQKHHTTLFNDKVKCLLRTGWTGIGGAGLKIHPDLKYVNLYHWLLGDTHDKVGSPLPNSHFDYPESADVQ